MFTTKNLLILILKNTMISIFVITISFVFIYIINSKTIKIIEGVESKHKLENELKKRTELLSVIDNDAQIIGENYNLINKAFVPSDNISEFMNAIDNLDTRKTTIQKYRFESPIVYQDINGFNTSTINYSNNINLGSEDLLKYLKNFEKLPYFTKIVGIKITSQSQYGWKDSSTNVTLNASLLSKTAK